jgi:hypothetical protein
MKWYVEFEENGGEYHGYLIIEAEDVRHIEPCVIVADRVKITVDEIITEVTNVKEN